MAREAQPSVRTTLRLILGAAALLALLATAAAIPMTPGGGEGEAISQVLVGDLKLADDDEPPSNGVRATFQATNLAPGDRTVDRLRLSADPPRAAGQPLPTRSVLPATLSVTFEVEQGLSNGPLARALVVEELAYGSQDLAPSLGDACDRPVTLATLLSCPGAPKVLSGLKAPPPTGTDLVLGLRMDPGADEQAQGDAVGFAVHATLEAGTRATEAPGPLILCVDLEGDDALVAYVEEVDVPVTCEVVF